MIRLGVLFFIFLPILSSAQQEVSVNDLWGAWETNQYGYPLTLQLSADGSGVFDSIPITYQLMDKKLSITVAGIRTDYSIILKSGRLSISGGDLEDQLNFERKVLSDSNNAGVSSHIKLIGVWSDGKEMISFKNDGTCNYGGATLTYSIAKNHIVLTTPQGKVWIEFKISGNRLSLLSDGSFHNYTKVAGQ